MIEDLSKSKDQIKAQESSLWRDVNSYERELSAQLEQNKVVDGQVRSLSHLYERLRSTNFINEVFKISSQDQFGTISGFRLGRIDQLVEPEWDEINTALGQAAYLMAVIAHRFGYKFEKYKINLCGAMSTIELRYALAGALQGKKDKYELYYGVNYGGGSIRDERFNTALTYLLDALDGLISDVQSKIHQSLQASHDGPSKKEPWTINGAEIGGHSIKYKPVDSQNWTLAMKFFLTNLQWLVYQTQLKDIADQ